MSNPARTSQYDRPAQHSPDWDPTVADPLTVDDGAWMFDAELAYYGEQRRRAHRRTVLAITFAALVVVLAILAAALLVAAPRTNGGTDAARPRVEGRPGVADGRGGGGGRHVPRMLAVSRAPEIASAGVLPDTSTSVSGTASWFCGGGSACTRGYPPGTLAAAAGPALRVGDWRGRIVKVCGNGKCVRVILADWCACPRRVIDLYRSAFSRLANPSRGLLRVSITWGGSTVVLPPTDTR